MAKKDHLIGTPPVETRINIGGLSRVDLAKAIGYCDVHPDVKMQHRYDRGTNSEVYYCWLCESIAARRSGEGMVDKKLAASGRQD